MPLAASSPRRRGTSVVALIAFATIVTGCATPGTRVSGAPAAVLPDVAFEVAGRLSARHGKEAAAANFRWNHTPGRDALTLATPMGSTLARLQGDESEVRLELPDGRNARAPDWESLTANVLGTPIPVRGLASWVRGSPHPRSAHDVERDAHSRIVVLRQDGWEIVYGYAADERPRSLRLTYPDTEIRLVLDSWGETP